MSKVLVVTGGGRGIGAAVCRMAARDGWDVCVNYREDRASAEAIVGDVEAAGRRGAAVRADITRLDDIGRLFDEAEGALGPVTGLVNNAGITGGITTLVDADPEAIRATIDLNVTAAILCAREAVRRMSIARGGSGGAIVNISSISARLGSPNTYVWYAASKGAIDSFAFGLAAEVIGQGIRVNTVSPGITETEIHAAGGVPDRVERLGPKIPIGRAATPEEIAETVVWLLSDASSYCVGANLEVGGGR